VCVVAFSGRVLAQQITTVIAQQATTPKVLRRADSGEKVAIMRLADAEAAAPQGYSVVLVLGDMQTAAATDGNVPAAARKALTDMKDFLPYKSYRLLDAQWILGSQKTMTRLRGPNDQDYDLTLRGDMMTGKLRVSFRLQDPGVVGDASPRAAEFAAAQAAKLQELQIARAAAESEAAQTRERGASQQSVAAADQKMSRIRREIETMKQVSLPGSSAIIDTSFAMDVGETVVVGTSRVRGGDKALIALLTAVPKGTGTKKDD
jgi:hypothetical protein